MKPLLIILFALFSTNLMAQTDIDRDGDGLIDINHLEDLDEIRHHLNGLPPACGENNNEAYRGYELIRSLGFNDDTRYLDADANKERWTTGAGWQPIGDFDNPFNALFMASTETLTISNLTIDKRSESSIGLFGVSFGGIADIHLSDVSFKGYSVVGGLVNDNQGVVNQSYRQANEAISDNGVGEAQDDLQRVSSFSEWSSANWDFTAGEYPGLQYAVGNDEDGPACETPPPDTELPNCGALLAEQRFELERIELVGAGLLPDFDLAIDNYVAGVSAETTNVMIIVRANRKDTPIRINGNVVSVDAVNVVELAEAGNTQIEVVSVAEATTYTIVVRKITLPPCHALIEFPDDNDGIAQTIDIDKNNNGLIEICDLEGLDEIRYRLNGTGYKTSADAVVIMTGCPADGCRGYELTKDLDFTDNDSYRIADNKVIWTADKDRTNSGWTPIDPRAPLTAIFEGNNHTIANLYINMNDSVTIGLFSVIRSEIRNVNLSNVDINGFTIVGGLVGLNGGLIINSRMTGSVSATLSNLGGLVGVNGVNAEISNSSASGTVTGPATVGGLVGLNISIIRNSFASGIVTGTDSVGGLSGITGNDGLVINSHADSTVNGTEMDDTGIGGLIGTSSGFIMGSHASGAVNVDAQGNDTGVGGLVGQNSSLIINSYATGATRGHSSVGGLVGLSEEGMSGSLMTIINSYATGDASGTGNNNKNIGGLIGHNNKARIINTYAEGDVSGISNAGGLIGLSTSGTIENSYTIGAVRGTGDDNKNIGGMVGATSDTVIITASYWNRDTGGQATSASGTSKTRMELQSPTAPGSTSTEIYYNWNPDYPAHADWDFGDSQTYPALRYAVGPDEDNAACDDDPDTILPQCSLLLPDQPGRDRGLDFVFFLLDADDAILELEPSLSPLVNEYKLFVAGDLNTIRLRPFAVNGGATTIKIIKDEESPEENYFAGMNSGDTSSTITLDDATTPLVVTVAETINSLEIENVYRFGITKVSPSDISEITVFENGNMDTDDTVDEGSQITLSPTIDNGTGNYRYEVRIDGEPTEPVTRSSSSITIKLPTNLVSGDELVEFKLVVEEFFSRFSIITSATKVLTVRQIDNGSPDIEFGVNADELFVSIKDPDGDGTASYRWQRLNYDNGNPQWVDLPSETNGTLNPSPEVNAVLNPTASLRYRVEVTYRDAQGYETVELVHFAYRQEADDDNDGLIEIYYLEDLDAIRYQFDGSGYRGSSVANKIIRGCPDDGCIGYELARSLDFNDDASYVSTANKVIWTADKEKTNVGWPPIDSISTSIIVILDGNGRAISNLYIDQSIPFAGLFGRVINPKSEIRNIRLLDVDIQGTFSVGGLVALNAGYISNSRITGSISGSENGIGGLIGTNSGEIKASSASGTVTGNTRVGGLIGDNSAIVIDSYSDSTVNGTEDNNENIGGLAGRNLGLIVGSYASGSVEGRNDVGGLVGFNDADSSSIGRIFNSYASGNASGTEDDNQNIGGLVGINKGVITNTYAAGNVSGVSNAGGLIGLSERGMIKNSYTIGAVSGTGDDNQNIGGIVGATSGTVTIVASYWRDTGGQATSVGSTNKTAMELQSPTAPGSTSTEIYYNWNPDYPAHADWDFGDSQTYPALRYAVGPDEDNAACDDDPDTILPQCSLLLPDQPGRDRGLDFVFFLPDLNNAIIEQQPSFSPLVDEYKLFVAGNLNTIQLRPFAVNGGATAIKIIKDEESPEENYFAGMNSGDTSGEITLNDMTTTLIVTTADTINGIGDESTYRFTIEKVLPLVISDIEIVSPNNDGTVNEGIDITLHPKVTGGIGNYRYKVETTPTVTFVSQTPSAVKIRFAANLVPADKTTRSAIIKLTVTETIDNKLYSANRTKRIVVKRINNGNPILTPLVRQNNLLDVTIFLGNGDPDGGLPGITDTRWRRLDYNDGNPQWTDITTFSRFPHRTGYQVPSNELVTTRYRVDVTHTDGQSYQFSRSFWFRFTLDDDDDGLIDIYYLEDLDAIRDNPSVDQDNIYRDRRYTLDTFNRLGCSLTDRVCVGYELRRSLDFFDDASYILTSNKILWTQAGGGAGWQPIGDLGNPFNTRFNSTDTLVISNLFINRPDEDYVGLFGVTNGQISGVDLRNVNIGGRFVVGGIAGMSLASSLISDSSVDGTVSGNDAWIGGLVGTHYGAIVNSHARGEVIGDTSVGGLAGYALGPITNSYAHSTIRSQAYSGGLVGYHQGQWGITNSYASGSVESVFYVGGLVGYNDGGIIANAYALGDVVGGTNVGGLVGYNDGGEISATYALGNITGAYHVDGLAGDRNGGSITDSYTAMQLEANLASSNWSADNWATDGANRPKLKYGGSVSGDDASERKDRYGYTVCGGENMPSCGDAIPDQNVAVGKLLALSELTLSVGTLEPPFDPSVNEYELFDISGLQTTVMAVANNTTVTVAIGLGSQTISMNSQASLTVQLAELPAANIVVTLTASDQTTNTYTITLPTQPDLSGNPLASCNATDIDTDDDGLIEICDIEGLYGIRYQLNRLPRTCGESDDETCKGYELERNLDFDTDVSYRNPQTNKAIWSEGRGWRPIGTFAKPFNVIFNANDHTIANLRIDSTHRDYVGMFGHISTNAKIEDTELADASVQGRSSVGALVGSNDGGTIIDSHTSNVATTTLVIGSGIRVGGLVGDHKGIVEHDSYTSGIVRGNRSVGGLVGYFRGLDSGENALNHGIINSYAESAVHGRVFSGGLVGTNLNRIINSYAIGDVQGIYYTGGLVGFNGGTITNTYAYGDVNGWEIVGGLVADNRAPGSIVNSYTIGTVSGQRSVSVLVGNNSGTIGYSYGVGDLGLVASDFGGTTTNSNVVVDSAELQTSIGGWDAENEWSFEDGKYPALRYRTSAGCESDLSCGQLLRGQLPELVSLTVVEPEIARLSMQNEFSYLLRIAEDITRIILTSKTDDATTVSYSINNVDFNAMASGDSLTIDPLPKTATAITIRLESSDAGLRSVDYIVEIERIQSIRALIQVRVFLEGSLREISP